MFSISKDFIINKIEGRQVLDSRGNPTIEVTVFSGPRGKNCASAIVPSGASTGIYEALELRDKNKPYFGKGVLKAISNIKSIEKILKGQDVRKQREIDNLMLALDGTDNKSKLGANTILGVSMACIRLSAKLQNKELYQIIAKLSKRTNNMTMPIPFSNVINGGKHAGNELQMQEFMIVPTKAKNFAIATQMVSETYHALKKIIEKKYGKGATAVGDEGGFAPPLKTAYQALDLIMQAIKTAGYEGKIKIAMDPAASEFFKDSKYHIEKTLDKKQMLAYYKRLISKYPIISIEDAFEQDDFDSFAKLHKYLGNSVQDVGDDLLVTNPKRIKMALRKNLCNALLLKVNQIGSITEALDAAKLALDNNWHVMVSHRSGETEDTFIADLAVGLGCGEIKIGSPCRGERTAKYNRLLRIEDKNSKLEYPNKLFI